jgi:hypothetical protein
MIAIAIPSRVVCKTRSGAEAASGAILSQL